MYWRPGQVEEMFTPGATTSGLRFQSGAAGPRDENVASVAPRSLAPTQIARREAPGVPMVKYLPPLPAATTQITPAENASSTACEMGLSASPTPPRLRLMMSTASRVAGF